MCNIIDKLIKEQKETIGLYAFFDFRYKAKIVKVVVEVIDGYPTLVYLTEGDFVAYIQNSGKFHYPTTRNMSGEYTTAWLEGSIESEDEHEKRMQERHEQYEQMKEVVK